MKKMSMNKAIAAILAGIATVVATVFSVDMEWLSPELTVTIGSAVTALLVWLVPNKVIE